MDIETSVEFFSALYSARALGKRFEITEGSLIRQDAWDDLSLIRITREKDGSRLTVIFHAAEGSVQLPELAGKTDLLTGEVFSGTLTGFRALVFQTA